MSDGELKICEYCGKEFADTSGRGTKRFCSTNCSKRIWERKNREQHLLRLRFNNLRVKGVVLTVEQKQEIKDKLNTGICEICHEQVPFTKLCVDHDHHTLQYRGVICDKCNMVLGIFKDQPAVAQSMINYMIDHETMGVNWSLFIDRQPID